MSGSIHDNTITHPFTPERMQARIDEMRRATPQPFEPSPRIVSPMMIAAFREDQPDADHTDLVAVVEWCDNRAFEALVWLSENSEEAE
jgi:hypothetical protein